MSSTSNYVVECVKCDESKSSDEFAEVREFAFSHQKHTAHSVAWTRTNIDAELSRTLDLEYHISCSECEENWQFEDEDEAQTFQSEHRNFTDHEPEEIEYVEQGIEVDDPDSLITLINRLNNRTPGNHGAPREVVVTAARHRKGNKKKVENWLDRLLQAGELYEPIAGHYRVV